MRDDIIFKLIVMRKWVCWVGGMFEVQIRVILCSTSFLIEYYNIYCVVTQHNTISLNELTHSMFP